MWHSADEWLKMVQSTNPPRVPQETTIPQYGVRSTTTIYSVEWKRKRQPREIGDWTENEGTCTAQYGPLFISDPFNPHIRVHSMRMEYGLLRTP